MTEDLRDRVLYEARDGRAYITLNRPEKRNAVTYEMFDRFMEHIRAAEEDDDVRVIVIRGEGQDFCTGHDLAQVGSEYGFSADKDSRRPSQRRTVPGKGSHPTSMANGYQKRQNVASEPRPISMATGAYRRSSKTHSGPLPALLGEGEKTPLEQGAEACSSGNCMGMGGVDEVGQMGVRPIVNRPFAAHHGKNHENRALCLATLYAVNKQDFFERNTAHVITGCSAHL